MSGPAELLPFLGELTRFINAPRVEKTSQQEREQAAYECLRAFLGLVTFLLDSIRSGLSVRQLLIHILQHLPVKISLEEPVASVKMRTFGVVNLRGW